MKDFNIKKLTSQRLFLPVFCLVLVLLVNIMTTPDFFSISIRDGVLYGYIIDIINRASELVILAIGMTLVVSASAGTDISVGAIMAVSAAVCCNILTGGERAATEYASPLILGFLAALVIGMLIDYVHGRPRNRAADHRWTDYICTCGELQDPGKLPPTCASTDTVYCGYAHGTPDGTAFKKDGAGTVHSVGRHQRKGLQAGRN